MHSATCAGCYTWWLGHLNTVYLLHLLTIWLFVVLHDAVVCRLG